MGTTKRQRQKAARARKVEEMQKQQQRKQAGKKSIIAIVVIVVLAGSAIWLFTKPSTPVVSIPTTTTTTTGSMTGSSSVPGFAAIATPLAPGSFGTAPTVTVPTTPPPTVEEASNLIVGNGTAIKLGDTFTAQYVLADYATHKVLQSSWTSQPFACDATSNCKLQTGGLITGWVNGMVGMKVGGRRELIIPPALGYGNGSGNGIPGNDTLLFVIDLLKVN